MKKIKTGIYIESGYAGVTLGALLFPRGTLLVDAPLKMEEARAWLADLRKKGAKGDRVLVSLDSHPDRTLGTQALDAEVIAHRESARQFRRRAAIIKSLRQESGAEWEGLEGLSNQRWVVPRLVFSERTRVHLGEDDVWVEAHPGPSPGASWVIVPDAKVVFVGDTVALKQPPFLALADIPAWVSSLDLLLSKEFKGYRIFSGRGGEVKAAQIRTQRRFLKDVEARLKRLAKRRAAAREVEKLVPKLISKYRYPAKLKVKYRQRLKHGLQGYYTRHYLPSKKSADN